MIRNIGNFRLVTPEEHGAMNRESISIKCEVDTTEIKEALKLIAQLKKEVLELKELGIKFTLKNSKTILDSKNDLKS